MTETEYLEIDKRTNRTIKFFRVRKNSPTVEFVAEGAKLHFGNRDIDTLTCTVPVGFLKKDDQVVVSYKTVDVFRGTVESRVAHRSRGLAASETVTVSGPWSQMSRQLNPHVLRRQRRRRDQRPEPVPPVRRVPGHHDRGRRQARAAVLSDGDRPIRLLEDDARDHRHAG